MQVIKTSVHCPLSPILATLHCISRNGSSALSLMNCAFAMLGKCTCTSLALRTLPSPLLHDGNHAKGFVLIKHSHGIQCKQAAVARLCPTCCPALQTNKFFCTLHLFFDIHCFSCCLTFGGELDQQHIDVVLWYAFAIFKLLLIVLLHVLC